MCYDDFLFVLAAIAGVSGICIGFFEVFQMVAHILLG